MKERVLFEVKRMINNFYSVGYLHVDVRFLSGEITQYVSVTKDKFGEVYLNLIMINAVLKLSKNLILTSTVGKSHKFLVSVIARAFKIVLLIDKLDKDYFIEFQEELVELGTLIGDNHYLMNTAIKHGFDVNWLVLLEIPENIVEIHKNIKNQGFLK